MFRNQDWYPTNESPIKLFYIVVKIALRMMQLTNEYKRLQFVCRGIVEGGACTTEKCSDNSGSQVPILFVSEGIKFLRKLQLELCTSDIQGKYHLHQYPMWCVVWRWGRHKHKQCRETDTFVFRSPTVHMQTSCEQENRLRRGRSNSLFCSVKMRSNYIVD